MVSIPYVIEKAGREERVYDLFSRLLKDRIVFLGTEVSDYSSNIVIAQFLFLANDNPKADINLYINSPGGAVTAGLAIYDTMQYVPCDVATYAVGQAASVAALLLAAGTRGKRYALPNSRMVLHQPWSSGIAGTASDIAIQAEDLIQLKKKLIHILAHHSGKTEADIERDTDRDFILWPEQAKAYGLVDEVLTTPLKVSKPAESENK
jgi:ATP-dependent Clp protease protease subunit